jgi:hypothetical protein
VRASAESGRAGIEQLLSNLFEFPNLTQHTCYVKHLFTLVVACCIAIVVFVIFVHPATVSPDVPLDSRLSGRTLQWLFSAFVAVVMRFLGRLAPRFTAENLCSTSDAPIRATERLALTCAYLC